MCREELQILDKCCLKGLTNVRHFGIIGRDNNFMSDLRVLASHATQRGRDSVV